MRKFFTTMALLLLIGGPAAMAQTRQRDHRRCESRPRQFREAPVGHRQPRADQVPSEKNLGNPNNPVNKEDAALDRKIRSICRGC